MSIKTYNIPYQGRAKYPKTETIVQKSSGGGTSIGGGGTTLASYTTNTGDTNGTYTVTGSSISTITDGTVAKIKLNTTASSEYNTLSFGIQVDMDDSGVTSYNKLLWSDYDKPMRASDYDKNSELTLTYRNDAGSYTATTGGIYDEGTVVTDGWVIDSVESKMNDYFTFIERNPLSASTLLSNYNFGSVGEVISYGDSALTPTALTIVDNLNSDSSVDALSAKQGKVLNQSKQATLISGTNIKTINNQSLLGSGNIEISGGSSGPTYSAGTYINITDNIISVSGLSEGYVDLTTNQTIDGRKSFEKTISSEGEVIAYGDSALTPTTLNIIDNLNSTATNDALSANQGRVLKNMIETHSGTTYTAGENISIEDNEISVTGINSYTGVTSSEIRSALGYTPANGSNYLPLSGGTVTGGVSFSEYCQFSNSFGVGNNKALYLSKRNGGGIDAFRLDNDNNFCIGFGTNHYSQLNTYLDGYTIFLRSGDDWGQTLRLNPNHTATFASGITANGDITAYGTSSNATAFSIVDNLNSTATNDALSANQGKVLADLISELQDTIVDLEDRIAVLEEQLGGREES